MSLAGYFTHLPAERRTELHADLEAFANAVLDETRIPELMQDLLESGALVELPYRFTVAAQHCVDQRLCHFHGRALH